MEKVISARVTVSSESFSPSPVKKSSAATPVTISGVTRGSSVTAPIARPVRERMRSRPRASMVPSTSAPSAETAAMPRLAPSDTSSVRSAKKAEYHRVLNPLKVESDFTLLKLNSTTATIGK